MANFTDKVSLHSEVFAHSEVSTRQTLTTGMLSLLAGLAAVMVLTLSPARALASECSVITKSEFISGMTRTCTSTTDVQVDPIQPLLSTSTFKLKFSNLKEQTLDRYINQGMGQLSTLVTPLEQGEEGRKLFLDVDRKTAELKWQWNF